MFGSGILDVIIALVTLYFLLSVICSALAESVSLLFSLRAANLINAIEGMLFQGVASSVRNVPSGETEKGTGLSLAKIYNHGLIWSLGRAIKPFPSESVGGLRGRGQPAYIPADVFGRALVDLVARAGASGPQPGDQTAGAVPPNAAALVASFRAGVEKMHDVPLKRVLGLMLAEAAGDYDLLRKKIEGWYDQTMDRARGWYKGWATTIITVWAVLVCLLANADTISIVRTLSVNPDARKQALAVAVDLTRKGDDASGTVMDPAKRLDDALTAASRTGVPLGWSTLPWEWKATTDEWAMKLVGLALTVAAVSLGAPFWFDLLNKLVNIRLAGKPASTASDQKEEAKPRLAAAAVVTSSPAG